MMFDNAMVNVLHVRVNGRSLDFSLDALDLNRSSSDRAVRDAVARHLDLSKDLLRDHVVDRHANGNLTLRPAAVFG